MKSFSRMERLQAGILVAKKIVAMAEGLHKPVILHGHHGPDSSRMATCQRGDPRTNGRSLALSLRLFCLRNSGVLRSRF